MIKYEEIPYLSVELPEDVTKEKWSGNFDEERKLIDMFLSQTDLSYAMRCRLEREKENIEILLRNYTIPEEEAYRMVCEANAAVTKEEFDCWRRQEKMDWIYVHGKRMFSNSFFGTLNKVYPELLNGTACEEKADEVDEYISSVDAGTASGAHIHIRQELFIVDDAVEEGKKIRVHVPLPVERDYITDLQILRVDPAPDHLPSAADHQPTAYFEDTAEKGKVYSVEYCFESKPVYRDLSEIDPSSIDFSAIPDEEKVYLQEELPHLQFTPYLRYLAQEIKGDEKNPLRIARKIYDFVTTKVVYRYMRDYAGVDNISQYCAASLRGDCGVQALLFIVLCRISGIPAKWQSGLVANPNYVGQHDWAMFYLPSVGWVYADPSYGGSAYRKGRTRRWNYFFGNLDPYRVPINDEFQKEFDPPKKFSRIDPYDNQSGEIEYEDHGVYGDDLDYRFTPVDIHAR